MIKHISIRNFAIIEQTEIDFQDGLNIITGETGAGKSIVITAVSLALGSRADTAFVRSGANKAVVQMIADDPDDPSGREVILSREISAAGRNICRIDDEIVTLAELSRLSRRIADIHGQYDHQSLLDPGNHIRLLDSYESDPSHLPRMLFLCSIPGTRSSTVSSARFFPVPQRTHGNGTSWPSSCRNYRKPTWYPVRERSCNRRSICCRTANPFSTTWHRPMRSYPAANMLPCLP
ncbi:MAG: AAA family ATPase [Firmicutes bacterium]|nr:AAA family ATPase [Bacillota bacterium]